jgi:hypothetical protein
MNRINVILSVFGISMTMYAIRSLHMQNKANSEIIKANILTIEFTKAGMVAPALKFEQPASIHIITDENNTLIDVQVIPVSK